MKGLTIYQPYASLIALGKKRFETRSYNTDYRGIIAIHAGKRWFPITDVNTELSARTALIGFDRPAYEYNTVEQNVPYGAIIVVADLVDCWSIVRNPGTDVDKAKDISIGGELNVPKHHPRFHKIIIPTEQEILFGDWTPGRYAWELKNIKRLSAPIPCRGQQRLWNVTQDIEQRIMEDIGNGT